MMEDSMVLPGTKKKARSTPLRCCFAVIAVTFAFIISSTPASAQKTFSSPEEAVKAAIAAARSNNDKELLAIFGPQAKEILSSGDPVADKQRRAEFVAAYDQTNRLSTEGENRILIVGKQDWPFPIPVVQKGQSW